MNTRLHASIALALIGLASVTVTHQAEACGLNLVKSANGHWTIAPPANVSASAARKMFLTAGAPQSRARSIPNPLQLLEPIAGLYEVSLISEGTPGIPDGSVVDHGYSIWHADGSEIMNSGRPAGDTNFCLGTWAQTGKQTYKLNHFTLTWFQTASGTPDSGSPVMPNVEYYVNNEFAGPGNVSETITLAKDRQSFMGTFTITQYDISGHVVPGFPVKGNAYGTRLTIDSPPFSY